MKRSWILPAVAALTMAFDAAPAAAQQVPAAVAPSGRDGAYQQARCLH
jgi:hypothetical protein